jgi:hypothetical protein
VSAHITAPSFSAPFRSLQEHRRRRHNNARDVIDFGVCCVGEEPASAEYGLIGLDVDHSFVWFHIAHVMSVDVGGWCWIAVLQVLRLKDNLDSLLICHTYAAVGKCLNFEACVLHDRVCGSEVQSRDRNTLHACTAYVSDLKFSCP